MNGFLEKTKQSLIAAESLLQQSLYASSINCSFYACLQTALHVIFVILKHDKKKFINDMKQKKTGTHEHVSNLITEAIKKKNEKDAIWFRKNFSTLKTLRVKAVYEATTITQSEGYDALTNTNTINNLIRKIS